jgi:ribosomal-protein-alanine N-acetyltransferase
MVYYSDKLNTPKWCLSIDYIRRNGVFMMDIIHGNGVHFRRATESDASRILEIDEANFKEPFSLNTIMESIDYDITIVAVNDADTVLGYIIGVNNYDTIDIISIAVDEKHKRRGIAENLLRKIIGENGEFDFWLEVRENNAPAIALYEKIGFLKIGVRKGFYREYNPPIDGVTMKYYK